MTIGKSVIRGEIATFTPSFFPYFKVSEKTRARRGPGAIPAARPKLRLKLKIQVLQSYRQILESGI